MRTELIALLTLPLLLFASCSDDDDSNDDWVPENVKSAFYTKYNKESIKGGVEWERKVMEPKEYYVAEFWNTINGKDYEIDAYYDLSAVWQLSRTEINKDVNDALIPEPVRLAINSKLATEYAGWYIDDIDRLEQVSRIDTYIFELEKKGSAEVYLVFDKDGKLITTPEVGGAEVSAETKSKFEQDFKDKIVGAAKWKDLENYKVVEFNTNIEGRQYEVEAWYDNKGNWFMTETEVKGNINDPLVPEAVRKSFEASKYKGSKVDDVDMIERVGVEPTFVIEIDGNPDVKLFFAKDGILINEVIETEEEGNNSGLIPSELPSAVKTELDSKFTTYRILEIDTENRPEGRVLEVEIVHNGIKKEVLFDKNNKWVSTEWDIRISDMPKIVTDAIKADLELSMWKIDDVDCVENKNGLFYRIEFEKGDLDMTLAFNEKGEIIVVK